MASAVPILTTAGLGLAKVAPAKGGWLLVWQGRGPRALYRVGRWQARLVGHQLLAVLLPALAAVRRGVESLLAALLLALAAAGVAAVLYGLAQRVGL